MPPLPVALNKPPAVIVNPVPTLTPPKTISVAIGSVYETDPPPPPPAEASTHCDPSTSV